MLSEKLATLGLLERKGILKQRLLRHKFCPWHHQQNVITCYKLYCRCNPVKFWYFQHFYERSCYNLIFVRT